MALNAPTATVDFKKTFTVLAADVNAVATSQTPLAAGALTLDGVAVSNSKASFLTPQPLSITCAGLDAGRTFTIVAVNGYGESITFTMAGADAGTTSGTVYVSDVISVTVDAATAGAIEVGVLGKALTPWLPLKPSITPFSYAYAVDITTATFSVESTLDISDPNSTATATVEASGAVDVAGSSIVPCKGVRVNVSAFTTGGVTFTVLQVGT